MSGKIQSTFVASLILFSSLVFLSKAQAAPELVPVDGAKFSTQASMADNLRALSGKRVSVMLDSGITLTGIVGEVGMHLLHLERLERKEYYDALVRIDDIRAIETRFREIKR